MRKFILRLMILALLPLGVAAAPAKATPHIPWGCELLKNTGCDCLSPSGAVYCLGIH